MFSSLRTRNYRLFAAGQVVSNTGGRTIEAGPGGSQLVHFAPTKRISTYLVALIAGPYARVTDSHDGIAPGNFCLRRVAGGPQPW